MSTPGISVVVPSFNCERVLERTLQSLLSQTRVPDEILVVDDGSTDNSVKLAECFAPLVRVVRQANAGASQARFRGVQESRYDFVLFNDADDVSRPERVAALSQALLAHPSCVAAYGNTWIVGTPEPTKARLDGLPLDGQATVLADPFGRMLRQSFPLADSMNIMVRRDVALESGGVSAFYRAGNDYAFQIRTAMWGSFVHVGLVLLEREILAEGLTRKYGWLRQKAFSLCAAGECYLARKNRSPEDTAAFVHRVEVEWPGMAVFLGLRGNFALSRRVAELGLRVGRLHKIPRSLWWAVVRNFRQGGLQ